MLKLVAGAVAQLRRLRGHGQRLIQSHRARERRGQEVARGADAHQESGRIGVETLSPETRSAALFQQAHVR